MFYVIKSYCALHFSLTFFSLGQFKIFFAKALLITSLLSGVNLLDFWHIHLLFIYFIVLFFIKFFFL